MNYASRLRNAFGSAASSKELFSSGRSNGLGLSLPRLFSSHANSSSYQHFSSPMFCTVGTPMQSFSVRSGTLFNHTVSPQVFNSSIITQEAKILTNRTQIVNESEEKDFVLPARIETSTNFVCTNEAMETESEVKVEQNLHSGVNSEVIKNLFDTNFLGITPIQHLDIFGEQSVANKLILPTYTNINEPLLAIKRTWQPKKIKRRRKHGFRHRMSTPAGRKIIKRRREKGRHFLAI
eukprot:TRINITY_DN8434_c0_g1_i1.p1 TRINITY_DN8434_c0_g1~~TRINITY_DN8434_c0_g1_i1.p1  ORF type:complete len:236 (-),score=48.31 TRINITY_DN8434_c0_g1_i1:31-738(-)